MHYWQIFVNTSNFFDEDPLSMLGIVAKVFYSCKIDLYQNLIIHVCITKYITDLFNVITGRQQNT